MLKEEQAICYIHDIYYAGFCECPICKEQKENYNEYLEKNEDKEKI